MRKIFHFDSDAGPYQADAAVVWCFDDRFTTAVRKFLKRRGISRWDSIRLAGGAKSLASPGQESERAFVLDQIRLSCKLHGTKRVILLVHSDCGAYGGLARFGGDVAAEMENHRTELASAAATVLSAIPGVPVECFFADFQGIWEVGQQPETSRAALSS